VEVTEHVAWSSIPDLPDIFDSDEPIQSGLLEKLLAEDDGRFRADLHNGDDGSGDVNSAPNSRVSERRLP
jgi:hypothetical protein